MSEKVQCDRFFSAEEKEQILLNYVISRGMIFSLTFTGMIHTSCEKLCSTFPLIQSAGCIPLSNVEKQCSDVSNITCSRKESGICELHWTILDNIELSQVSNFTIMLPDSYMQEVIIDIMILGQDNLNLFPPQLGMMAPPDYIQMVYSHTTDKVQLPPDKLKSLIFFGLQREYELLYVIGSSEQSGITLRQPGIDWKMQTVFRPVRPDDVQTCTSPKEYVTNANTNSIIIVLQNSNVFLSNNERHLLLAGPALVNIMVIVMTITSIISIIPVIVKVIHQILQSCKDQLTCATKDEKHKSLNFVPKQNYHLLGATE